MKDVMLLVGAGQIGMAIARRMGNDKKIIVGDKSVKNANEIAKIMGNAGFDTEAIEVDLSIRASILNAISKARYINACKCGRSFTKPGSHKGNFKSRFVWNSCFI